MKIEENKFDYKFLNFLMYFGFGVALIFILRSLGFMDKIVEAILSLTPVFLGILICWISSPLAKKLRKFGLNKSASAFISLIIIFGVIIFAFSMLVPIFVSQFSDLVKEMPNIYNKVVEKLNPILKERFNFQTNLLSFQEIISMDVVKNNISKILNYSINTVRSVTGALVTIGTTIIVSFFMVKDMDKFKDSIITFLSKNGKDERKYDMLMEMDSVVMSYVKGAILDSIVVGILTTIVCMVLGLDYAVVFGILITILNLIPYIGAIVSEVVVALYALTVGGPVFALVTFGCLVLVQIIDANLLQPNIIAKSVNLHPVVVLSGLIVFQLLFGIAGMIIAMPVLAMVKVYLEYKFSIQFDDYIKEDNGKNKKKKINKIDKNIRKNEDRKIEISKENINN